jgi:hypothetical protein
MIAVNIHVSGWNGETEVRQLIQLPDSGAAVRG